MATYRWNEQAGRYTDSAGRFVSEARVRAVIDDIADAASERLAQASARLLAGDLSLGAWQAEVQATIKLAHVSAAVLAHGGAEQMTFSRWGAIGPVVKSEYQFLRQFAEQIADGRQPLNGSLTARARQYGQAGRVTYERIRSQEQERRGYVAVKNVLAPAEHCQECRALTAQGWMPIEAMTPIGSRTCRGQDKCRLIYSKAAAEAA